MNLIVAVDKNWAIGQDNKLLAHIPEDMKFFREKTMNQVVIMGRKTLESFPGENPLKNRINIVITTDKTYKKENAIIVSSIEEAIIEAKKHNKDVFVIGGASIYKQMLIFYILIHQNSLFFRVFVNRLIGLNHHIDVGC